VAFFHEPIVALASTRGLVCLRGTYSVANPATSSTTATLATALATPNVVATRLPPAVEFQDDPKHVKPKPVAIMTIASKTSCTPMDVQLVFDGMQRRYITNLTSASWMGVVLSGSAATEIDDDQKVSEEMSAPKTLLLEPLLAMVDKGLLPPLPFLIQGDIVQFRPTTWAPHWLSFDPGPMFKLEQCYSSNMVDYDLMNWFFNWLWKPPWFSFRYYQAVLKKHGKSIAGFLILGGFKFHPYTPCFFVIFLNLMDFKLGYRWTAMACLFSYSHGYGPG
jgi:hypothetical protein